jgi:hypothetical protein
VKQAAKALYDAFSPIVNEVRKAVTGIFGSTTKSVTDMLNIFIFKIVFIFQVLSIHIKRFSQDFVKYFNKGSILDYLTSVRNVLGSMSLVLSELLGIAGGLGGVFGKFFEAFSAGIQTVLFGVQLLLEALLALKSKDTTRLSNAWDSYVQRMRNSNERIFSNEASEASAPTPASVAPQLSSQGQRASIPAITWNIGDINLNVTEGSARQAGSEFAAGLTSRLKDRNLLMNELLSEGGR